MEIGKQRWQGGGAKSDKVREERPNTQVELLRKGGCGDSEANDVMMRSGSHDSEYVDQIASHLGHTQTRKHTYSNPSYLAHNHTQPNP